MYVVTLCRTIVGLGGAAAIPVHASSSSGQNQRTRAMRMSGKEKVRPYQSTGGDKTKPTRPVVNSLWDTQRTPDNILLNVKDK